MSLIINLRFNFLNKGSNILMIAQSVIIIVYAQKILMNRI
jgi:hypothetical protein